jgi:hypothetical protein
MDSCNKEHFNILFHERKGVDILIQNTDLQMVRSGNATLLYNAAFIIKGATEIGWHCWATNTPSIATALKLGFEKGLDYSVYFCQ